MAEKIRYDYGLLAEAAYTAYVYKRKTDHPERPIHWSSYGDLSPELQDAWIASARAMVKAAKHARK